MKSTGILGLALALPPDKAVALRGHLIPLNIFFSDLKIRELLTPTHTNDRSSKQIINNETQVLNDMMRWIALISSGHSIQMQNNTPSSQVHMEHSPG